MAEYVVAPPSPGYERDEEAPIADPPQWLIALMDGASRNGSKPPDSGEIHRGRRNDTLASLAGTMRRRGMSEAAIAAALKVTNRERCKPPLPEPEVDRIAASVASYEPEGKTAADLLIDMEEAIQLAEEPISYPIEPIAARGFLTILAGRHSSFKSWVMIATGYVAHRGGGEIAGMRCEPTTTLYVDAENGPRLMGRRFTAAGIPADGLMIADGDKLRLPRDLDLLRALIEETRAGLVVLDSLRRLAPAIRENESDDMAALIADIGTMSRELNVAIVLIHHRSTKAGAATLRGSSSIEDQSDLVFTLERVSGDPDRERRRLKAVKYRIDAEPPSIWLRMGKVDGRFVVDDAEPHDADGPGRPRERDHHRDDVLAELGDKPRSARGIARSLDMSDRTVRRILDDLAAPGLAINKPDGWVRHNPNPLRDRDSAAPPDDGDRAGGDAGDRDRGDAGDDGREPPASEVVRRLAYPTTRKTAEQIGEGHRARGVVVEVREVSNGKFAPFEVAK